MFSYRNFNIYIYKNDHNRVKQKIHNYKLNKAAITISKIN